MATRLGAGASLVDVACVWLWLAGCRCGLVGVDESGGVGMRSEPSETDASGRDWCGCSDRGRDRCDW